MSRVKHNRPDTQLSIWACPRCGQAYTVEDTGDVIVDQHNNAKRRVMRFYPPGRPEVSRCIGAVDDGQNLCNKQLHITYNHVAADRAEGR